MSGPAPSEVNPGIGSDLDQSVEPSSPNTPNTPLSRREFETLAGTSLVTSLGSPVVNKLTRFFNLPRSAEELALLDMSKEARQLIEGVLAGNPEAVTYVLKNMLSVNPDSVQPYQIGRDKEGKEKSLWDFSLVSQIPRWTNSLLSDQAKETFSKRHGQKPKLVQINLSNFRLTPRQAEGLFDLLGGKRKDQLVHDLTKVGLTAGGAALMVKGGADALEGVAKIVKSKNSSAGKEEVAKGLLEGAVGIEAVNYVMLTDADIYNSLTADQQKALQTVAIALFPPAWVSACLSTNPSLEESNIPTIKEPTSSPYPSPTPGTGGESPEPTPKPPSQEPTPSPNPPGKEVDYPGPNSNFLWEETRSSSEVMIELEDSNSVYYSDTINIKNFYNRVARNEGFAEGDINFIGSIGRDTWVIAMKYQGKFYTLKERDGLLLSEITPFSIYNEDPSKYTLVEVKLDQLPPGYTQNDIRIVQDDVSTYHMFATSDKKYYLDLTQDKWLPITANVEVIPTGSAFNFEVGNWAENEDGTFNAQKMFPLVGAVDKKHHQTAPLTYNALNIALVTQDDIAEKNLDQRQQLIANQAVLINDNIKLKNELDRINQAIVKLTQDTSRKLIKPEYFYVVIKRNPENGFFQITQIVFNDFGEITRYKRVDQNSDFIALSKEEEPQLLPKLFIDDKVIKRSDTNETLELRGITVDRGPFREITYAWDELSISIDLLKLAKSWGANFVRIHFTSDLAQQNIDDFIKLVKVAESMGIYIAFTLSSKTKDTYAIPAVPDSDMIRSLELVANSIKNHSNALIEIYNDPHADNNPIAYNNAIIDSIVKIRSTGYENPIIVPGNFWSLSFKDLDFSRLAKTDTNIIFKVHDGPWWLPDGNIPIKEPEQINGSIYDHRNSWTFLIDEKKVPFGAVMVGETGIGSTDPRKNSVWDIAWQEYTIDNLVVPYKLSFTQWDAFDTYNWGDRKSTFPNTQRGKVVFDFFQNEPIYQFDR